MRFQQPKRLARLKHERVHLQGIYTKFQQPKRLARLKLKKFVA